MRRSWIKLRLGAIGGVLVIALILIFIPSNPTIANPDEWLSGYDYRKEITINGSPDGNQTNYQMPLTVHKGTAEFVGYPLAIISKDDETTALTGIEPVIVGEQRYSVTCTGVGLASVGVITVWEADEYWERDTSEGHSWESPYDAGECYAQTFPDQVANKIIIYGVVSSGGHNAFIASFDVTTHTWDWQWVDGEANYLVYVIYDSSTERFYIVPSAGVVQDYCNWVWKSTAANLLIPENWVKVNLPSWGLTTGVALTTHYTTGYIAVQRTNHYFYYDVLLWQLSDDTFSTKLSSDDTNTYTQIFFPKIVSWDGRIGLSLMIRTPSHHFEILYSDDGDNYTHVADIAPILTGGTGYEETQCGVIPIENDLLFIANTRDGSLDSEIRVYELDGTLVETHDHVIFTHASPDYQLLYDGDAWVWGGEQFDTSGVCQLLIITKGHDVYLEDNSLSWEGVVPNDIRFTKVDGETLLDYWIEESDANDALVWVEIDSIPERPDGTSIYIYYGKADDTSVSSGVDTFPFFDDFKAIVHENFEWGNDGDPLSNDGGNIDWTITVGGASKAEIDIAQYYAGARSARLYRDGTNDPRAYFNHIAGGGYDIDFYIRTDGNAQFGLNYGNGSKRISIGFLNDEQWFYYDGSSHNTGESIGVGVWAHLHIININWDAGTYDIYVDGVSIQDSAVMQSTSSSADVVQIFNAAGTSELWFDDISIFPSLTSKWTHITDNGLEDMTESVLTITGATGLTNAWRSTNLQVAPPVACRMKLKYSAETDTQVTGLRNHAASDDNARIMANAGAGGSVWNTYNEGVWTAISRTQSITDDFHIVDIKVSALKALFDMDNVNDGQITTNIPDEQMYLSIAVNGAKSTYCDWVFSRAYTLNEPTWGVIGSEEPACSPSIELNTSSWDVNSGVPVAENADYSSGLDYFTITNNSGGAVSITIHGTDMAGGGYIWDLADDGSPGDMTYGLYAGLEGGSYNIIVRETATYNTLKAGLADEGTQSFGLKIYTPTNYDDGNEKTGTITLTVTCD